MTACDVDIEIVAATDHGNDILNRGDEDYFESTPTHDHEDPGVWIFSKIYQFKLRLGPFSPLIEWYITEPVCFDIFENRTGH